MVVNGTTLNFRGWSVLNAVLTDLLTNTPMAEADQVRPHTLISGCDRFGFMTLTADYLPTTCCRLFCRDAAPVAWPLTYIAITLLQCWRMYVLVDVCRIQHHMVSSFFFFVRCT